MIKKEENIEYQTLYLSTIFVIFIVSFMFHSLLLPGLPQIILEKLQERSLIVKNLVDLYPVIVDHPTYTKPKPNQIPVYSFITSGGSGGITPELGFHTLTDSDTLFISYSSSEVSSQGSKNQSAEKLSEQKFIVKEGEGELVVKENLKKELKKEEIKTNSKEIQKKIPANYRFRNDFALKWDNSPEFAIASVELKGYKYFRDMLRQIRENFAPPGLNLVWRDNAGVVISQPIKPQIVRVLFLLDYDGTVKDVKVVSSMGQKPVDEACVRVLLNQNFGPPPKEIFENGNIFGINFVFPPIY